VDVPAIAGDPRFFARSGPHTAAVVAAACGAEVPASDLLLHGVAPLQSAGPEQISFIDNRRYARLLAETRAGAVIVHPDLAAKLPPTAVALITPEPYLAWARTTALFHPPPPRAPGVHATAVVEAGAKIDATAEIGPHAVVGAGASIGARCRIGAGAVIGPGVEIGPDCRIGAHASVSHALIGARVYLYPGVRRKASASPSPSAASSACRNSAG